MLLEYPREYTGIYINEAFILFFMRFYRSIKDAWNFKLYENSHKIKYFLNLKKKEKIGTFFKRQGKAAGIACLYFKTSKISLSRNIPSSIVIIPVTDNNQ